MENNINTNPEQNANQQPNVNYHEYGFSGKTLYFLNETGKWSQLYSIFTLAIFGICILIMILAAYMFSVSLPNHGLLVAMLLMITIAILAITAVPMIFLMRSSSKIKKGIHQQFLPDLLKGIDDMTSFFKISTIVALIMTALIVIGFCLFVIFQSTITAMIPNMQTMV